MYKIIFVPFILLSFGLKADESLKVNYDNMKLGVGYVSSLRENREMYLESQGFEFSIGYNFESKWLLETGFTVFPNEIQPNDIFLRTKKNWQVSDYASIYAGLGSSYLENKINPTINAGINYYLNNDWYVDVGYQLLNSNKSDDTYSFLISLNYKFSGKSNEEKSSTYYEAISVITDTDEINTSSSEMELQEKKQKKHYDHYKVKKYDNLTKISKKLGISLDDIILANPLLSLKPRTIHLIYPGERIFYPIYEPLSVITDTDEINTSSSETELQGKKQKKHYDHYKVTKYDNLTKISKKLDISLDDIILANPLLSLKPRTIHLIYPGERIFYPIK